MPPQNTAFLNQAASGFAPIASGLPHQQLTGFEGVPGMNQPGLVGIGMQTLVAPQLQQMMMSRGMMPMGLHDQNVYDTLRNMQFTRQQQEAMQQAAEMDRAGYVRTFRGLAAMTGTPWGTQQRRAARELADTAVGMSPVLAQVMPELLDQMSGMRGSATVMAQQMMLGSRYRIDPVTGAMGMTGDSVGQMSRALYQDLYESGDLSDMRGLTAGRLGQMYDQLARRGMLRGDDRNISVRTMEAVRGLDPGALRDTARNVGVDLPADVGDLSADDLDKLRLDPAVASRLRAVDTESIKRSLSSYVDAVGAMRDIFGDLGQPNAPMQQLIGSLEALTQGGVSQFDPGRMNMMVRTTHELARQSGMTLDSALALQQHGAGRLEMLGMSPLHAPLVAQGSMAWGGAFRAMGGNATPAWGRFDANGMQQLDTNLRANAFASQQANRMGLLMRVRDRVGGFEKGSRAEAVASAISAGLTEYVDPVTGETRSTRMSQDEFFDLMQGASGVGGTNLGLTEGSIETMLGQRKTNEEFINEYDIGSIVRRQMPDDTREWLGRRFAESLENRLVEQGMSRDDARKAASAASGKVAGRVMGLSNREFADDDTRTGRMAEIIQEELGKTDAGAFLGARGLGEDFFELTAEQAYGYANRAGLRGRLGMNMQNMHAMMNEEVLRRGGANRMQARLDAQTADALSPLGRGTILQRAVQFLQDADGDEDLGDLVMESLGGVASDEVRAGLQKPLIAMRDDLKKLAKLRERYSAATTPEGKAAAMRDIEAMHAAIRERADNLVDTASEFGIYTDDDAITMDDVDRTTHSLSVLRESRGELAGIDKERFAEFWDSDSGAQFRENAEGAQLDVDDLATRAIMSDQTLKALGPEALEQYDTLRKSQDRINELALYHTGGDLARLLAGDYDIDTSTAAGKKLAARVGKEVGGILEQQEKATKFFRDGMGKKAPERSDEEIEELMAEARKRRDIETQSTSGMLREVFETYGLDTAGDQDMLAGLGKVTGSEAGRGFLRRILASSDSLRDIAKRGYDKALEAGNSELAHELMSTADDPMRGAAAMLRKYQEVQATEDPTDRAKKLRAFQRQFDFKVGDSVEFDVFEREARIQQQTGVIDAGDPLKGRESRRKEILDRNLRAMMRGGEYGMSDGSEGRDEIYLRSGTLSVDISGRKATIEAEGTRRR